MPSRRSHLQKVAGARWPVRLLAAVGLASALAFVPYRLLASDGYVRYDRMREELDELERHNRVLREQNRTLRREIGSLRHDLDAIATVARDELGLIMPGEIVVGIDDPAGKGASP